MALVVPVSETTLENFEFDEMSANVSYGSGRTGGTWDGFKGLWRTGGPGGL